jgi:hypothetical protein
MNDQIQSSSFEFSQKHDIRNLHGAPGWFELATEDPKTAAAYLRELNGWEFQEISIGGSPYLVILLGATRLAASGRQTRAKRVFHVGALMSRSGTSMSSHRTRKNSELRL